MILISTSYQQIQKGNQKYNKKKQKKRKLRSASNKTLVKNTYTNGFTKRQHTFVKQNTRKWGFYITFVFVDSLDNLYSVLRKFRFYFSYWIT